MPAGMLPKEDHWAEGQSRDFCITIPHKVRLITAPINHGPSTFLCTRQLKISGKNCLDRFNVIGLSMLISSFFLLQEFWLFTKDYVDNVLWEYYCVIKDGFTHGVVETR